MGAVITLTTDFGTADPYVAAMKGMILGINPDARLVDISHSIEPQNIPQAAYILSTAHEFFPQRTIHLAVVDPGVGTARKAVILRTPEADFVAPDNGLLSYVIESYARPPFTGNSARLDTTRVEAVHITNPAFWRPGVSATFHGRDIFAPVAAHLSLGIPPAEFGEAIDTLSVLPSAKPRREPDGTLVGQILHIDHFGNLITNIRNTDLPGDYENLVIVVRGKEINGLVTTYAAAEGLCALIGSSDYLEIALKNSDAADFTGASIGDEVKISVRV